MKKWAVASAPRSWRRTNHDAVLKLACWSLFAASLLAAAGCTSKAEQARKRYEFLKQQHASLGDVCAAGRAMVSAYADAQDANNYSLEDAIVGIDCQTAEMDGPDQPYGRPPTVADNMDEPTTSGNSQTGRTTP